MIGLRHPQDLAAWASWQRSGNRIRQVRTMLRPSPGPTLHYRPPRDTSGPTLLVALDSLSPTSRASLLTPFQSGPLAERTAFVSLTADVPGLDPLVPVPTLRSREIGTPTVTVAIGHFLPAGAAAFDLATARGSRFVTVQHGLLTPFAPPLAPTTTLLAWSAADATYWSAGRTDVTTQVVGSTLLWDAATTTNAAASTVSHKHPVYLGQLHGAELARRGLARSAELFCRDTPATYRPHPSETDKLSRLIHRRFERQGIAIDRGLVPLRELTSPVVSVFSTGVLEAAAAGRPAWVHHDDPPQWLQEFWARYRMATWGDSPTPAPPVPDLNPAEAIAHAVRAMMEA